MAESSALVIEDLPPGLRRPILLATFAGWNDAAESATSAARFLAQRWSAPCIARILPEEFYHFGLTRPEVRIQDGSQTREIRWPANEFFLSQEPSLPRDVIVGIGIEPHLKWQTFCSHILEVAGRAQVTLVITLGALLADVPHTRPIQITGVSTDPELAARLRTSPTRYEGPTGIVGVLNDACRRAGLPVVSLWASVPHYVSEVSNPHAILALVRRVLEFLEWQTDVGELEEAAAEFDRQLTRIIAQKPEVARYIQELEQRVAREETSEGVPSGDLPGATDLIREVEQFLREHRRETGQG
ncbi:MAG: PAC2 family protein [candidate division NC10 bacterium]|nr:PAC2 family protein [candidate division NC10 bacterium]MBI4841307.1 PAC2 family protein [candidate division NC10 bacterium]